MSIQVLTLMSTSCLSKGKGNQSEKDLQGISNKSAII